MDDTPSIDVARRHFAETAGWPRHVANETALEFERLCRLRHDDPAVGPLAGSLLAQFARQAGLPGGTVAREPADEVAACYRRHYGHPPPYPWHASSPSIAGTSPGSN